MKKFIPLLSLIAMAGTVAAAGFTSHRSVEVNADELEHSIEISDSSFFVDGWANNPGTFGNADSVFWGENRYFNSMGSFFRGESNENWDGVLTSRTWKQKEQYVYFTWSAQNNSDYVYLEFMQKVAEGDDVSLGILKNDTFVENPMMLRYFKLDDGFYDSLGGNTFDMYVKLVDLNNAENTEKGGAYRFNNFGYLHVNQTADQVSEAMRLYLNSLKHKDEDWTRNKYKEIARHYYLNYNLRTVFLKNSGSGFSEDFEDNNSFLANWYFDYEYANNFSEYPHFDKAISDGTRRPGDSNMPFNKSGNKFFRGWFEESEDSGFVVNDYPVYRFISKPFTLTGSGFVSFKMSGTASLHIIDPSKRTSYVDGKYDGVADSSDLAWIDNKNFNTVGDQYLTNGFNTVTMTRHIVNLTAYLGQTIQLAIADISAGGWGAAYFDEINTNYNPSVGLKVESLEQIYKTVVDAVENYTTYYPVVLDRYVSGNHDGEGINGVKYHDPSDAISDTSAMKEAAEFVTSYMGLFRNYPANGDNFCSVETSDEAKTLLGNYNGLSGDAKTIVCNSDDYRRVGATSSNWSTTPTSRDLEDDSDTTKYLGYSIAFLGRRNNIPVSVGSYTIPGSTEIVTTSQAFAITAIASLVAIVVTAALVVCYKKRKED